MMMMVFIWLIIVNHIMVIKTAWWYTYPSEKYESQWEGLENKKCLKPPTSKIRVYKSKTKLLFKPSWFLFTFCQFEVKLQCTSL